MKYFKILLNIIFRIILVIPYNLCSIAKDLLNPLLYSSKLRLVKRIDGKLNFKSKHRAIFVLYQYTEIPFCIINVLKTLKLLKINCTINVNEELGYEKINQLAEECDLVLVRKNFGRDFAAYKDSILLTDLEELDKLILLNDSMFYFEKGLTKVFEQLLDKNYDVVGLTENFYKEKWHIQSFIISLSKNLILNKNFSNYWKEYKCFNNRKHAIKKGEVLLSQKVLKPYYDNTKIIYSLEGIIREIKQNNVDSLFGLLPNSKIKKALKATSIPRTNSENSYNNYFLLDILENSNITHTGAFVLPKFYGSAIVKKDILYKRSFRLHEVLNGFMLIGIKEEEFKTASQQLKIKGDMTQFGKINYLLTYLGVK